MKKVKTYPGTIRIQPAHSVTSRLRSVLLDSNAARDEHLDFNVIFNLMNQH